MNIKLLLTGLSIILLNILLGVLAITQHVPYISVMLLLTVFSILLWVFLLRKDVPLTIKAIDTNMKKSTLALILIPLVASVFILTTAPSVDYGVVGYLFVTAFLVAMYEEILFRMIGLGSLINAGLTPFKAILFSSLIFAFSHLIFKAALNFESVLFLLNSFIMGIILGYIYFKTKNIVYIISIHFIWDCTVFLNQRVAERDVGLLVTVVLLAVSIWYFIWSIKGVRRIQ